MKKRKRSIAILLAIFFGWGGGHKFYLNKSGSAIFYIMLTIFSVRLAGFSIATILGLVDAARMLMMDQRTFDRKYNWEGMRRGYDRSQKRRQRTERRSKKRGPRAQPAKRKRSNQAKRAGLRFLDNYDLKEAIEELNKAKKIDPRDAEIYFRLAGAYSLTENTRQSLINLDKALKLGHPKEAIHSEDHLAFIRIQPAFQRFLRNDYTYIPLAEDDKKPIDDVILQRSKEELKERNR